MGFLAWSYTKNVSICPLGCIVSISSKARDDGTIGMLFRKEELRPLWDPNVKLMLFHVQYKEAFSRSQQLGTGQLQWTSSLPNPGGGVFIIIIFFLIWYFCSPCSPARRCSVFQKEVLFWFTRRQRDSFFSWQNTRRPLHKSTTHCLAWHLWLFQAWFQLTFALFPRYLLGKTLHLDTVDHFSMPVHALFFLSLPLIDVPV